MASPHPAAGAAHQVVVMARQGTRLFERQSWILRSIGSNCPRRNLLRRYQWLPCRSAEKSGGRRSRELPRAVIGRGRRSERSVAPRRARDHVHDDAILLKDFEHSRSCRGRRAPPRATPMLRRGRAPTVPGRRPQAAPGARAAFRDLEIAAGEIVQVRHKGQPGHPAARRR